MAQHEKATRLLRRWLHWLLPALIMACTNPAEPPAQVEDFRPQISEYLSAPAMLVFSGTSGWRHDTGISGADLFFAELATEKGYGLFTTEHPGVFNAEDLARFEVIIFNNVTGAVLNQDQRRAFEDWMLEDGAWIGLHGTGDYSMGSWQWYQTNLIGTKFIGHIMAPQFQDARLVTLAEDHPILSDLPETWIHRDEWYSFDRVPQMPGLTLLVGLDETSYTPENPVVKAWPSDLRMGSEPAQHPVVWARCDLGFRAVYSAIGHQYQSYRDSAYRNLLSHAFDWVTAPEKGTTDTCTS